jgi:DUF4097 and DUF4098 domain-containing protein YvlB
VSGTTIEKKTAPVTRGWLVAGVLVTVAVVAFGTVIVLRTLAGSGTPDTQRESQAFQHRITAIELELDSGNITLLPGDSDRVDLDRTLRWRRTRPAVVEQWNGDTLRVSGSCHEENNCSVDYVVRVPADVAVRAHTEAGAVTIRGITGGLDVMNRAGDITVADTAGGVRIRGSAGNVTGSGLRSAEVDVQTSDGNVTLSFATAPASARAVVKAGAIRISVPRAGSGEDGYHVQANTTHGRRQVSVAEDSAGGHSILAETVDGDVTVQYA